MAWQVEFWARLGKSIEPLLRGDRTLALLRSLPDADKIPSRLQLVATLHVTALEPFNTTAAA